MKPDKIPNTNRKAFLHLWGYLGAAGLVLLATLVGSLSHLFLNSTSIVMLYLLGVVLTAIRWGLGPSVLACVLGVLAHDFFFVRPIMSLGPPDMQDIPTLIVLLAVGVIISLLASQVRQQTQEARRREVETHSLYVLSRELATTDDLEASVRAIMSSVKQTLGYDVSVLFPEGKNKKVLKPYAESTELTSDENEIAAATWSFHHQNRVGQGTDIFPNAKAQYVPLITARGAIGVIAVSLTNVSSRLAAEQERLLDAFADLAAVAVERIVFAREALNMQISQAATEKLQTAFLDSISHDLRTPLASVVGVLSSLQEGTGLDDATKENLIQLAREEAERLNSSITEMLDISRIESGAIRLSRQLSDVNDIISVALDELGNRSGGRTINVDVAAGLPFVPVDFALIVKVLLNLLDNTFKYSLPDSPVEVKAHQIGQEVEIDVADRGIGIPPEDLQYVFQRFFRVRHPANVPGIGLGLSICKGIVVAHGGRIAAENRPGGGTVIRLTLPLTEPEPEGRERLNG